MKKNVKTIAYSGVFTALITAATLISIPIPATQGYINAGEILIFTSCFFFNPIISLIICGLGPALADLILGYAYYAPFTFAIKAVEGLVVSIFLRYTLYKVFKKQNVSPLSDKVLLDAKAIFLLIAAYSIGTLIMTGGYFLVNCLLYEVPVAVAELPFDLLQGLLGLVASLSLDYVLAKVKL